MTAYIKDGEELVDRWHVLAGACHEWDSTNLNEGKRNAADVRSSLEDARQWLHELKVILQAYEKEKETLDYIKSKLQGNSKGADQSQQAKQ